MLHTRLMFFTFGQYALHKTGTITAPSPPRLALPATAGLPAPRAPPLCGLLLHTPVLSLAVELGDAAQPLYPLEDSGRPEAGVSPVVGYYRCYCRCYSPVFAYFTVAAVAQTFLSSAAMLAVQVKTSSSLTSTSATPWADCWESARA